MNLLKWALKNKTAAVTVVALLIFAVVLGFEVFTLRPATSAAVAELKAAKAHAHQVDVKAKKDRTAAEAAAAAALGRETALLAEISVKDAKINGLSATQAKIEADLAHAKTDSERVPLLQNLLQLWTQKYTLADWKCRDYQGIVFNLHQAIAAKDVVISTWKAQYEAAVEVENKSDAVISRLRSDLRRAKFWSTVKSGVIIGAAGYGTYRYIWPIVRDFVIKIFKLKK